MTLIRENMMSPDGNQRSPVYSTQLTHINATYPCTNNIGSELKIIPALMSSKLPRVRPRTSLIVFVGVYK